MKEKILNGFVDFWDGVFEIVEDLAVWVVAFVVFYLELFKTGTGKITMGVLAALWIGTTLLLCSAPASDLAAGLPGI